MIATHLSEQFPQLMRPGEPSERMLSQAIKLLEQSGRVNNQDQLEAAFVRLCEKATKEEPWFFLPRGPRAMQAMRLLLDRMVSYEEKQLYAWLTPLLASESCKTWFDGSLVLDNLPPEVCSKIAESFVFDLQGALSIFKLALILLVFASKQAKNETNVERKRDACENICSRVKADPDLARAVIEEFQRGSLPGGARRSVAPSALRPQLARSPSVLPVASLMDKTKARELIDAVDWVGFDLDFTLIDFHDQARLEQLWQCVRLAFEETLNSANKIEEVVPKRVSDAIRKCTKLPANGIFSRCCVIDSITGNVFRLDHDGRVAFDSVFHGTKHVASIALENEEQSAYAQVQLDLDHSPSDSNKRFIMVHTDFEMPLALAFAACVDFADEAPFGDDKEKQRTYEVLMDVLAKSFVLAQSPFFSGGIHGVYQDKSKLAKMLQDQTSSTKKWLIKLRQKKFKKLFLLSDAKEEHVEMMMSQAFGAEDWKSLFDLIIVDAKKSKYFEDTSPSLAASPVKYQSEKICRGGTVSDFEAFTGTKNKGVLYFGDHPWRDVVLPSRSVMKWKTVAVVADLSKEIMPQSSSSSSLTSTFMKLVTRQSSSASTSSKASNSSSTIRLEMGSSFICDDGIPTILSRYLQAHAEFCVPSVRYCASEDLFI